MAFQDKQLKAYVGGASVFRPTGRSEFDRSRQSEVKGMNLILAVVALVLTALSFVMYTRSADNKMWLFGAIVFLIATLVFGALFLSGRVNKTEDIHITE